MDIENKVLDKILARLHEDGYTNICRLETVRVSKLQESYDGFVCINEENSSGKTRTAPAIPYICSLEDLLKDGSCFEKQIKYIKDVLRDANQFLENMPGIDKEFILQNVIPCVGTNMAEDKVSEISHFAFLDLTAYYRVLIPSLDASFVVTNSIVEFYGITDAELLQYGLCNLEKSIKLSKLHDLAGIDVVDDLPDIKLRVLHIDFAMYSAGAILSPQIMGMVYESFGDGFYILPSSIHELLVIPMDIADVEALKGMVREVNDTALLQRDILSYSVYKCEKPTGEVIMC